MKKYKNPIIEIFDMSSVLDVILSSGQLSDETGDYAEDIFGG